MSDDRPVYVISVAAQLAGMHPQTLRTYDRLGLVSPGRASGRGRRYSERDVALLRDVARLGQEGVNLAGIQRIIELRRRVAALEAEVARLTDELTAARADAQRRADEVHATYRRDVVPFSTGGAVVVWRPRGR